MFKKKAEPRIITTLDLAEVVIKKRVIPVARYTEKARKKKVIKL